MNPCHDYNEKKQSITAAELYEAMAKVLREEGYTAATAEVIRNAHARIIADILMRAGSFGLYLDR
jgi:hypothetical protein